MSFDRVPPQKSPRRDPRLTASGEATEAWLRDYTTRKLLDRLLPVRRAFAIDDRSPSDLLLATALRVDGRPMVFAMRLDSRRCDPVAIESLLLQHGQATH